MTPLTLKVTPMYAMVPTSEEEFANALLLRLEPAAGGDLAKSTPETEIALVLDNSGSMLSTGQQEVTQALTQIAPMFRSTDHVAGIAFGSLQRCFYPLSNQHANLALWGDIDYFKRNVGVEGTTNMHAALDAAMAILGAGSPGRSRRILLLTDGMPDDKAKTLEAASRCVTAGIPVTCLAFGSYDPAYMDQLAALSSDSVWDVRQPGAVDVYFRDRLTSIQNQVAQNIQLEIEFRGNHRIRDSYTVHPTVRWNGDMRFKEDRIYRQTLMPLERDKGLEVLINLVNVKLPPGRKQIAKVSVLYDVPALKLTRQRIDREVSIEYTNDAAASVVDPLVARRTAEARAERHRVLLETALADGQTDVAIRHAEIVSALTPDDETKRMMQGTVRKLRGGAGVTADDLAQMKMGTQKKKRK